MEKKRFIFDLDNTLLVPTFFEREDEYFRSCLSKEDAEKFISEKVKLLTEYEARCKKYDNGILSKFLTAKSGVEITQYMIANWRYLTATTPPKLIEGVIPTLELLKSHDKSLVVLTNWFKDAQKERLKNAGLIDYFDEIYGGDLYLKPDRQSYLTAAGDYDISECIMIGDNLLKDVYGALIIGMDAIYFDPNKKNDHDKKLVKSMNNIERIGDVLK